MATYKGAQLSPTKMPIPSHGDASSVKCQRFVITAGAAIGTSDVLQFGNLPHYAKVVDAIVLSDQAITLNVGDAGDADRYFAAQALTANVAARMTVGTGFRTTPALGALLITGAATVASGAATKLELMVFYVIEDTGVGYPA
jgi:hypothetical protein